MLSLAGKTALVTGAGGGIGRAICRRFAAAGAYVVVTDLCLENASAVSDELISKGGQAESLALDVLNPQDIKEVFADVQTRLGHLDILVNNAGGSADLLHKLTNFADSDDDTWNWVLDLNLRGTMHCVRECVPGMIARKSGKVISIASIAAEGGIKQRADYSAAKAGIIAFTKAVAMEVGQDNVQLNCVSPGLIERARPGMEEKTEYTATTGTYLGRMGKPDDIAATVLFLASPDADYITGQNFTVDGGRMLGPKAN